MSKECNKKVLDQVYKNCNNSILFVKSLSPKVKEGSFKKYLAKLEDNYNKYCLQSINEMSNRNISTNQNKISQIVPVAKNKLRNLLNKSESAIAEELIHNSTKLIIKVTKKIKNHSTSDQEVLDIANAFIKAQQSNIDHLKTYL